MRQPWEMSKQEFEREARYIANEFQTFREGLVKAKRVGQGDWQREALKGLRRRSPYISPNQAFQIIRDCGNIEKLRRQAVSKALATGKPVPMEVLKDYPKLTN